MRFKHHTLPFDLFKKIAEFNDEGDQFEIVLEPGFCFDGDRHITFTGRATRAAILEEMETAGPCNCEECFDDLNGDIEEGKAQNEYKKRLEYERLRAEAKSPQESRKARNAANYAGLMRAAAEGQHETFVFCDGGRGAAGFTGFVGDCVTRAIAIATGEMYRSVWDEVRKATGKYPGDGVTDRVWIPLVKRRGFVEVKGVTGDQFDPADYAEGVFILRIRPAGRGRTHLVAVINGMIFDTWDSGKDARIILAFKAPAV